MVPLNLSRIVFDVNYVYITFKYTRFNIDKYLEYFKYKLINGRYVKYKELTLSTTGRAGRCEEV